MRAALAQLGVNLATERGIKMRAWLTGALIDGEVSRSRKRQRHAAQANAARAISFELYATGHSGSCSSPSSTPTTAVARKMMPF